MQMRAELYKTSRLQSIGRAKASSTLLCQFIESVTFARCAFIFALRNITLSGYLDTRRNIYNIYDTTHGLKYMYIRIYREDSGH